MHSNGLTGGYVDYVNYVAIEFFVFVGSGIQEEKFTVGFRLWI
jgi:hypothetical protein